MATELTEFPSSIFCSGSPVMGRSKPFSILNCIVNKSAPDTKCGKTTLLFQHHNQTRGTPRQKTELLHHILSFFSMWLMLKKINQGKLIFIDQYSCKSYPVNILAINKRQKKRCRMTQLFAKNTCSEGFRLMIAGR